ncbi:F-box protein [Estrella lausannensis]|uniref:F-box domain-containing protein n=1 Tax=Estrella lausannensis TaxID=483423 RepID=A0A0H5E2V2_9BACT|nr:F-box protein [Estrella lausannensis]CRX37530.1 F-box domain-containing protein [Estrella lausannensis]
MQTDITVKSSCVNWETVPEDAKGRILDFLPFSNYLTARVVSTSIKRFADQNVRYWSKQITRRFGNFEQLMTDLETMQEFTPYITPTRTDFFQIYRQALQNINNFSRFHLPEPALVVSGNFKQIARMPPCRRTASYFLIDESSLIKRISPRHFLLSKEAATFDWYSSFKIDEKPSCICTCSDMLFVGTESGNVFVYKISEEQNTTALDLISVISLDAKIYSMEGSSKDGNVGLVVISKDPVSDGCKASIYLLDASSPPKVKRMKPEKPRLVSGPFIGKNLLLFCPLQGGGIVLYDLGAIAEKAETMKEILLIKQDFQIKYLLQIRDHLVFATYDGRLGWIDPAKPEQDPKWLKKPFFADIVGLTPVMQLGFCLHGDMGERVVFLRQAGDSYSCGSALTNHMEDPQWLENGKVLYRFMQEGGENGLYLLDLSHTWVEEFLSKIQKIITPKSN